MEGRLLKYKYTYDVQGTDEELTDYALVYVPKDASFALARSVLILCHIPFSHKIIRESVEDMTIRM